MHLSCKCASKFAPEGQLRLQLAPLLRTSRRDSVLVRVSRPRSTRQFSGLFLPQQGIRGMSRIERIIRRGIHLEYWMPYTCRRSRSARHLFNRKVYERKGKCTAVVTSTSVTSPYREISFYNILHAARDQIRMENGKV